MTDSAGWRSRFAAVSTVPWYPTILAATVVVAFWLQTTVSPYAAFRSLVFALAGALTLTLVALGLTRNRHAAGLIVFIMAVALYSKRLIHLAIGVGDRMETWQQILWYVLIACAAVVAGRICFRVSKRGWNGSTFTSVANRLALLLLLTTLGSGLVPGAFSVAGGDLREGVGLETWLAGADSDARDRELPDIYVLMLDGYPRADVLEARLGHDNSSFISALEDRRFSVATSSHSDYLFTQVSLPSLLEMNYIEHIPELQAVNEGRGSLHPTLRQTLNESAVFAQLRGMGYTIVATDSGFEHYTLRQADVFVSGGQMNEFELQLLASTYLGNALAFVTPDLASSNHRARISSSLDALPAVATKEDSEHRFVFAHIPAPHQPAVFGPRGQPRVVPINGAFYSDSAIERNQSPETFIRNYTDQLTYLNELVLDTIDGIFARSEGEPIVIVMSDHGSASRVNWLTIDPGEAEPAALLERTGTLFAAYTPERSNVFPDDIAPVNVFRFLSDAYLGTDYGPADPPPNGGQIPAVDASVLVGSP